MNAMLLRSDFVSGVDWPAMRAEADTWCGRCVAQFTKVEGQVSEALLRSRDDKAGTVRLDYLAGQRSVELERLLLGKADAASQRAAKALQAFRVHERLRTFLCHGSITILVEEAGDWHILLKVLEFRKDEPKRDVLYLSRSEMTVAFEAVHRDGQRLGSLLGQLAKV